MSTPTDSPAESSSDATVTSWLRRAGPFLLVAASTFTAPLFTIGGITFTGDRLLGLLAVPTVLALRVPLLRTPIHVALAGFVAVQMAASVLDARAWPQGLKFMSVYGLGFACFALAAEWTRGDDGMRRTANAWVTVGVTMGALGTLAALLSNASQVGVWGAAFTERLAWGDGSTRLVFAGRGAFGEANLLSSFLLVPFALGLWTLRREASEGVAAGLASRLALVPTVSGLIFGLTRAAWIGMGALTVLLFRRYPARWRPLGVLLLLVAVTLVIQATVIGASPLRFRVLDPVQTHYDGTMKDRLDISVLTIKSWRTRPLLGYGSGSVNRLSPLHPSERGSVKPWNGNLFLSVLHDSGLVGLAALLGLLAVVGSMGWATVRRAPGPGASSFAVPLLGAGATLFFAYQFTHGLWVMYPYIYLGFLTGALVVSAGRSGDAATDHGQQSDRVNVLGVGISAINMASARAAILEAVRTKRRGYVCVANVHSVSEAQRDPEFRRVLNRALLCTPDGMPIVWMGRWYGFRAMDRVDGPDLMLNLCDATRDTGHTHFLLGGKIGVAEALKARLEREFPGIKIVGTFSPPFRPLEVTEENALVRLIAEAHPDIIWIGLGAPKQERFMAKYLPRLATTIMIGVGAAFDFHTGRVRRAPRWVQRSGLEWLFRLYQEPRRLWRRYLKSNPLFVWWTCCQVMGLRNHTLD